MADEEGNMQGKASGYRLSLSATALREDGYGALAQERKAAVKVIDACAFVSDSAQGAYSVAS